MMHAELRRQIPIHFHNKASDPNLLYVYLVCPDEESQACCCWTTITTSKAPQAGGDETLLIGLMAQDGDRWHSVDEVDERHIESSLMLDVAYGLLARRIREEDETAGWISEHYPFVDYSSVFENSSRRGTKIAVHIAEHDFDRLAEGFTLWSGMEGQEGRFEKMVNGEAISAHPDRTYKYAYWLGADYANTILAGAFLDAQGAAYELWWDMGGVNAPAHMILTNWASERRRT